MDLTTEFVIWWWIILIHLFCFYIFCWTNCYSAISKWFILHFFSMNIAKIYRTKKSGWYFVLFIFAIVLSVHRYLQDTLRVIWWHCNCNIHCESLALGRPHMIACLLLNVQRQIFNTVEKIAWPYHLTWREGKFNPATL